MLRLSESNYLEIVAHALDGYPLEACGLMAGRSIGDTAAVETFFATENEAASSRVYTIPAKAFLQADRAAEEQGIEVVGVVHSHTHTDAYPSPTDITQAPDPAWHYVIVSLRDEAPTLHSYRIRDGAIAEEEVVVERR